jgi:hypothetical protein
MKNSYVQDNLMGSTINNNKKIIAGRSDEVLDGARQQFDKFFKGNQN